MMALLIGVISARPPSAEDLKQQIREGATHVNLDIKVLNTTILIPAGVSWEPPLTPIKFGKKGFLLVEGPMVGSSPRRQLFDAKPNQVHGSFEGLTYVGWWCGWDSSKVADIAPHIEAAAMALRPAKVTLRARNKRMHVQLSTADMTGGVVRISAGVWDVRSTIHLGGKYVEIRGCGEATMLRFVGRGFEDSRGMELKNAAKNTSITHMQWVTDPSCSEDFVTLLVHSGFLEGTSINHIFSRGCHQAVIKIIGTGSNHFVIEECHFIAPTNEDSIAILATSTSTRVSIRNITVANIDGTGKWKNHILLGGYDMVAIERCHFESAWDAAISIGGARNAFSAVSINNCDHNWGGYQWYKNKNRDKTKGTLVKITASKANVTVLMGQVIGGDTVLEDPHHKVKLTQGGSGNKVIINYSRSVHGWSSHANDLIERAEMRATLKKLELKIKALEEKGGE